MPQTLGQVIAMEASARATANKALGTLDKQAQKPNLFNGFQETYMPFSETPQEAETGSKRLPPKGNDVQLLAAPLLESWLGEMQAAVNLARAKDEANCRAKADVVVEGETFLADVPATHLLHMLKVLADLGTFVSHLPVLDPSETWEAHVNGQQKTPETFTVRDLVKKVPLVLHEPTGQHPAQVAIIEETVPQGRWTKVKYSGALGPDRKHELERRVGVLKDAFRVALEEANRLDVPPVSTSESAAIMGYVLG